MSSVHKRFLVLEVGIGAAVSNLLFNALVTWIAFMHLPEVPFWGQQSIVGSTISTNFLLPFITCLIVTPLARKRPGVPPRDMGPLLRLLPEKTVSRGLLLGVICSIVLSPLMIFGFIQLHVTSMTVLQFILFMALLTAVEGALITPLLAAYAIGRRADTVAAAGGGA